MQKNSNNETNREKKIFWFLILLIILNVLTFFFFIRNRQEVITVTEKNKNLVSDQLALQNDLERKKEELNQINTDNTELQEQIDQQKNQIVNYIAKLKKNDKDLNFLAILKIKLKEYEKIITDLQNKNQELSNENAYLAQQNNSLKEESDSLKKEKEEFQKKLELLGGLQAHDFQITALQSKNSGKYVPVTKAKKTNSIKTCFTISENLLAEVGEKVLYLRSIDPKGKVLPNEDYAAEAKFMSLNGESIEFSEKRTIDYNKHALDACIFWNNKSNLLKGTYTFEVWLDGKVIGKSNYVLK